ncbi:hypothetical protein FRC08_004365 [Ceratobasidium sp. 394]|nr:hypothetical protein FRC08_004365 [Ceratobasidium sp. 394]KAG9079567.1 hypothetical protein FS749_008412 [Ceratobasidium sp. UAMH 11750]
MDIEIAPEDGQKPVLEACTVPRAVKEDQDFYFPDGNLYLRVNGHEFFVHRYKLGEFREIEPKLVFQPDSPQVLELEGDENDFRNTFKVLYASFYYSNLSDFDAPVLVSALRIATRFNHSALRTFAIDNLELKQLPPMDYLPLAREFDVPMWEARALDHLTIRHEPVTVAEAALLGTESFVAMIVRRERRLTQHHKPLDQLATDEMANSAASSGGSTEDIIDLCDTPEGPHGELPVSQFPQDPASPAKYPRTRSRVQEAAQGPQVVLASTLVLQKGVSKKAIKKRK